MKVKSLIPVLLCIAAVGCSSAPTNSAVSTPGVQSQERVNLDAKLKAMSPEERAKYVQEHPDEIRAAYSNVPGVNPQPGQ